MDDIDDFPAERSVLRYAHEARKVLTEDGQTDYGDVEIRRAAERLVQAHQAHGQRMTSAEIDAALARLCVDPEHVLFATGTP